MTDRIFCRMGWVPFNRWLGEQSVYFGSMEEMSLVKEYVTVKICENGRKICSYLLFLQQAEFKRISDELYKLPCKVFRKEVY